MSIYFSSRFPLLFILEDFIWGISGARGTRSPPGTPSEANAKSGATLSPLDFNMADRGGWEKLASLKRKKMDIFKIYTL